MYSLQIHRLQLCELARASHEIDSQTVGQQVDKSVPDRPVNFSNQNIRFNLMR
jgi:hypothetical protein